MRGIAAILSLTALASTLCAVHTDVDAATHEEAAGGWLVAQAPAGAYTFLYDVYWQSAFRPGAFDSWLSQNRQRIDDPKFSKCFQQRYSQWFVRAKEDMELCNKHSDPNWRTKCNSESTAQYLYLWGTSLREVLNGNKRWPETDSGRQKIVAWERCNFMQGGCEMLRSGLEQALPLYRPWMTCQ